VGRLIFMQDDVFEKLTTQNLRGRIAHEIREAILNGLLRTGERLVERKLATELGASLTAVREALIELEAEGFVSKKPNSATHVTKLSWPETERIFAVRRVLEGFAVEKACQLAAPEQLQLLQQAYLDMAGAAAAGESKAVNRSDVAFHLQLWSCSGNEYLEMALRRALLPYFAFGAIHVVAHDSLELIRDAQSHLAILEAIRDRDGAAGRRAFDDSVRQWESSARAEWEKMRNPL
jgi:DNA-binding GntR family transcriptional regulator